MKSGPTNTQTTSTRWRVFTLQTRLEGNICSSAFFIIQRQLCVLNTFPDTQSTTCPCHIYRLELSLWHLMFLLALSGIYFFHLFNFQDGRADMLISSNKAPYLMTQNHKSMNLLSNVCKSSPSSLNKTSKSGSELFSVMFPTMSKQCLQSVS